MIERASLLVNLDRAIEFCDWCGSELLINQGVEHEGHVFCSQGCAMRYEIWQEHEEAKHDH